MFEYDVAISFAGDQRSEAEAIARGLRKISLRVFYDAYEQSDLWGKDLYEHLADVYQNKAQYCLMLVSAAYAARVWTTHERRSAQARALSQKGEYILPVRFDDTNVPGLLNTVAYVRFADLGVEGICSLLAQKLHTHREGHADNFARFPDDSQNEVWLQESTPTDGAGMTRRGLMYAEGRDGVPNDDARAAVWFRKAAESGYFPGMVCLGVMYASGRGSLPKDGAQALDWFAKAAHGGDGRGMAYLGLMYASGLCGLRRDDVKAVQWFRKAADIGDARGMALLGTLYEEGRGGLPKRPRDFSQAFEWFHTAADEKQDAYAQRLLRQAQRRYLAGVIGMFACAGGVIAYLVALAAYFSGFWKQEWSERLNSITDALPFVIAGVLIIFAFPWAVSRVFGQLLSKPWQTVRWYSKLVAAVTFVTSAGCVVAGGLARIYVLCCIAPAAGLSIWRYRREKREPIGGPAVSLYDPSEPPVVRKASARESRLPIWCLSLAFWPAVCAVISPLSNNLVRSALIKLMADRTAWRATHQLAVDAMTWQPVWLDPTIVTWAGLGWGILYAIGVARGSFRWWHVFVVPVRTYFLVFDGTGFGDRWTGLLTALPLNFFWMFSAAQGLAYLAALSGIGGADSQMFYQRIMYSVMAVLTLMSLRAIGDATA